jgi:hypothetical protein
MITGKGKMKSRKIRIVVFIEGNDLTPVCTQVNLIFQSAGDLTGMATGTSIKIENESLMAHRIFSTSTRFS